MQIREVKVVHIYWKTNIVLKASQGTYLLNVFSMACLSNNKSIISTSELGAGTAGQIVMLIMALCREKGLSVFDKRPGI